MYIEFNTNLKLNECSEILKHNLGGRLEMKDFIGRVKNDTFWIISYNVENFGVRYGPPKFKGHLIPTSEGTLVKGNFGRQRFVRFLDLSGLIFITIIMLTLFIWVISDLFLGQNFIEPTKSVWPLLVIILLWIFIFLFRRYSIRLREEDKKKISEFLYTKLKAEKV